MPKQKKPNSSRKRSSAKQSAKKTQSVSRAKIYFLIGFTLLSIYGLWKVNQSTKYSFAYTPHASVSKKGLPTFIAIKDNNIFLPIKETFIQNGVWEISDDGASHLASSGRPGDKNTIIIYGHNTLAEFGSIPYVSVGEPIILSTSDGKTYTYRVTKTVVVNPTDIQVLTSQQGETLILYTCYGFADLQRYVIIAKPQ
jgi:LPXTG-site transpeptidase (sortase) family protein